MNNHCFDGLTSIGNAAPDRLFARLPDGRSFTYGQVIERTARLANKLVDNGLRPGDRVAVQVEKSIEAVFLYLATLRAGGVFLPLNPAYVPAEIDYFLNDSEPKIFVCDPASRPALAPIAERVGAVVETLGASPADGSSLLAAAESASPAFETVPRSADDLAAILYTSGTTGRSKGAMLTHDNLLSNAKTLVHSWRITGEDVLLHALPIFHTHGLFVALNTILVAGGSLVFLQKFDPDAIFEHLEQATSFMGVPTFYTRLLADARLTRRATAHIRLFTSGSAPLLAETHDAFGERTGHRILERYGMTETNMTTSNPYEGERRPGSVGPALPGIDVRISDSQTGRALPRGEVGMIEVKGPNVFKGYWRMPEKTAAEFRVDGYFITGDLGLVDSDGYVTIVGRDKDLIISGGFNVYPREVELAINALPGIVESAVIGVPHPDFGEAVVAIIVAADADAGNDLSERLGDNIAKFKRPKRVMTVNELPRNTMGKVQKNVLRSTYADLFASP